MHDPRPWRITLDALDTLIERAALDADLTADDLDQLAADLERRATTLSLAARRERLAGRGVHADLSELLEQHRQAQL